MAVTKTNNAEGFGSGTTLVNTSNSGGASGDAFNAMNVSADGVSAFNASSASPITGTVSYALTLVSGNHTAAHWTGFNTGGTGRTHIGFRIAINTPATWTGTTDLVQIRSAAAKAATIKCTSTGKIATYDLGDTTALDTTTLTLANSTSYDLAIWAENGTSTSNGYIKTGVYTRGTNTLLEAAYSTTAANVGTAILTEVRAGKLTDSTLAGTLLLDQWQASDTYTDLPTLGSGVPTGTATTLAGVFLVDGSPYTPAVGGGLTFGLARVSGPTLAVTALSDGQSFAVVPDTTTDAVYRLTVSEAGGGSATQDITIPAAATTAASGSYLVSWVWNGSALV